MKQPAITPLPGKTNVAIVAEQLEKLIREGFWKPEERIMTEAELCRQFNVGRSTVREALNAVKAKNLIHTVLGHGTFVSKPETSDENFFLTHSLDPKSEADLINIMELRLSIEPMNAAFAARRATREQLAKLREFQRALASSSSTNAAVFAESDLAFHILVAEATRNPVMTDVMNMVRTFLARQQIVTSQQVSRRNKAAAFHEHLLDAIAGEDDVLAEQVMREHMEDTYLYVKSIINISGRNSGRFRPRKDGKRDR